MSIINRLRKRPTAEAPGPADPAVGDSTTGQDQLPISGYDRLDGKEVTTRLSALTQVELGVIEDYERDNQGRAVVLDKLRYMRGTPEPFTGYDGLESDEIMTKLEGANGQNLRAVRDYERKFRHRPGVMAGIAKALPNAEASAGEARAHEEKAERVRARTGASPDS